MDQDYDYITLYLPRNGATRGEHNDLELNTECLNWLNTNVGNGTFSIQAWMLAHDTDDYDWCYLGMQPSPDEFTTLALRKFLIRDGHKALLFKLVWGG